MKKTLKIGSNRGKARIWIEGSALLAGGWKKGINFCAKFSEGKIEYLPVAHPAAAGLPCRVIAGTDARPIIDTNTDKIRAALGDRTHALVEVTFTRITITPANP